MVCRLVRGEGGDLERHQRGRVSIPVWTLALPEEGGWAAGEALL